MTFTAVEKKKKLQVTGPDSSVHIVTSVQIEKPRNQDPIPGKGRRDYSLLHSFQSSLVPTQSLAQRTVESATTDLHLMPR